MMMKISPQADRDLRRAAAARQPHLRLVVGADHRGVEIGEAVDLRAAEEADGHAPALQPVAEHLRHRHRGERGLAQFAVADRERQHVGLGGDGAGFVDQRDVGRMREPREVAGRRRHADADEADVVVAQRARRRDRHHLVGLVVGHAHAAFALRRRTCAAKASGPCSSTFSFIQARNVSRSRAIVVPGDVEGVVALVVALRIGRDRRRPARARSRRRSSAAGSRR